MATNQPRVDGDSKEVDQSLLYDALADRRRRYVLHYLKQQDEAVDVRDLAEQVAAWENDKQVDELAAQERKRGYIALYQSHLSTLDEEGLIEYDEDQGMVSLSDSMAGLDMYLEVVPRQSIPWSIYYAGLTFANGLLLAFAWYDIDPFNQYPDLFWGALVLVTFGLSSFAQLYYSRQMRIGDDGPPPEIHS